LKTKAESQAQETPRQNGIPVAGAGGPLLKKPTVMWKQTQFDIIIWIQIPDLTHYSLTMDEGSSPHPRLSFQSQVPGGYGFEFDLLGMVLPPIQETQTGQYLEIKIKKLSPKYPWRYLVVDNPKLHWLKRRLDEKSLTTKKRKGYDSDDPEEKEPSNSDMINGMDMKYRHLGPSDSDDDEIELSEELLSSDDED